MSASEDKNWLEYRGYKVLYRDYRDLQGQALVDKIFAYNEHTQGLTGSDLLMLIDVTGAFVDREVLGAFKKVALANRSKVHKTAVLGLEGVQKVFLDVVVRFSSTSIRSFDKMDDALSWLIQD